MQEYQRRYLHPSAKQNSRTYLTCYFLGEEDIYMKNANKPTQNMELLKNSSALSLTFQEIFSFPHLGIL